MGRANARTLLLSAVLVCQWGNTAALRWGVSAIVMLGSPSRPRACLGVQIAPQFVLTMASCAASNQPLTNASFVSPFMWASPITEVNRTTLLLGDVEGVGAVDVYQGYASRKSNRMRDRLALDLAIVKLQKARIGLNVRSLTLPLDMVFPNPNTDFDDDALITIDPRTHEVWVTERVVYVDNAFCSFAPIDYGRMDKRPICTVPVVVEDAQIVVDRSTRWSFLVRRRTDVPGDWILGFGDSSRHFNRIFRGFSWIAPQITFWITNSQYPGVELVRKGYTR